MKTGLVIAAAAAALFVAGCSTQGSTCCQPACQTQASSCCKGMASCKGACSCKGMSSCKQACPTECPTPCATPKKHKHHKRMSANDQQPAAAQQNQGTDLK